jgi:hypothetical protein
MTPLQECGLQLLFDEMELELSCMFIFQLLQAIIKVLTLQNHGLPLLFDETELELSFLHVVFSNCCRVPSRFLSYKASLHSLWSPVFGSLQFAAMWMDIFVQFFVPSPSPCTVMWADSMQQIPCWYSSSVSFSQTCASYYPQQCLYI